ncbi:hypothetical protein PV341_02130 [Streptomyces sp. PA03-1a]|nr:hypothetical protein [Streptomyces sp. PA03-1a]MDX2819029.1 hypothetical protein [Streptomyces sp. PA03-5A]
MTKPGAPTPRRVTADWAAALPGFDAWKPLHLLRRIGPVVQGVCLDRTTSGNAYIPTAHVHALTRDFPVISLMLGQRLEGASGQPERVLFGNHDGEYPAAVDALREQSLLSLSEEPPSLEQVVRAYLSAASASHDKGLPPAVLEVEDSVLIAAAAGLADLLQGGLALAGELAGLWSKFRLPLNWPGTAAWLEGLRAKATDPVALSTTVHHQVTQHKLARVRNVLAA